MKHISQSKVDGVEAAEAVAPLTFDLVLADAKDEEDGTTLNFLWGGTTLEKKAKYIFLVVHPRSIFSYFLLLFKTVYFSWIRPWNRRRVYPSWPKSN